MELSEKYLIFYEGEGLEGGRLKHIAHYCVSVTSSCVKHSVVVFA